MQQHVNTVFKMDQSKQTWYIKMYTTLWEVRHSVSGWRVGCVVEYFLFKGTLCRRAALLFHRKHKELIMKIRCFLFWLKCLLTLKQQSFNVWPDKLFNFRFSNLNPMPDLVHASSAVRRLRTWSSGLQSQLKSDLRRVSQWKALKRQVSCTSTNINKSTHKVILNKTRSQPNLGRCPKHAATIIKPTGTKHWTDCLLGVYKKNKRLYIFGGIQTVTQIKRKTKKNIQTRRASKAKAYRAPLQRLASLEAAKERETRGK